MEKQLLTIFGVTGDLTKRKLVPALYALYHQGKLDEQLPIVCVARRDYSHETFIEHLELEKFIQDTPKDKLDQFISLLHYCKIDFDGEDFGQLAQVLDRLDQEHNCEGRRTFFMSTPPFLYEKIASIIKDHGLTKSKTKVAIEKPFGYDLESAKKLNDHLGSLFDEEELYRIDHYLGKEVIQNLLAFRFSNAIFEQSWNSQFIDHIQITVSEDLGVGTRGGYYDGSGAIRDMLQNHLLEILSLVAMEQPKSIQSEDIRNEKVKILEALRDPTPEDIALGQYGQGNGEKGYRQEEGVPDDSQTETFVGVRAYVDTPRWQDMPFYIRTGKRMKSKYAEIHLVFKDVKCELFVDENGVCEPSPNVLTFCIQPDQEITISFNSKVPGATLDLKGAEMNHCYNCDQSTPESYQTLFLSLLQGNQTYFTRWDRVAASWDYADKVRNTGDRSAFPNYEALSDGPQTAQNLFKGFGRQWIKRDHHGKKESS